MAETYGIYDYKAQNPNFIATLTVGLPATSRIMRKYSGINITLDQTLLAMLIDSLNGLIWGLGGRKSSKKPAKVLDELIKTGKKENNDLMSFRTPEEYEAWMARKREKWQHG